MITTGAVEMKLFDLFDKLDIDYYDNYQSVIEIGSENDLYHRIITLRLAR